MLDRKGGIFNGKCLEFPSVKYARKNVGTFIRVKSSASFLHPFKVFIEWKPGADIIILKIFSPKLRRKNWRFCSKYC
jgi:hypothetical protein